MKISASFLSCEKIIPAIKKLNMTDVDYIHVDFIDNNFVKGKKIPFHKLKKISKISSKRLDIHLMTNKLEKYIKKFSMLNCEYITFHIEVLENVEKYINMIHSYGIKCGLAINPDTDFDKIKPYIEMIDLILVMSVTPGYGGQQFIPTTEDKLKKIRKYITDNKIKVIVNVDGGINNTTINKVNKYVEMVVSGSYITHSIDFHEIINNLRRK